MNKIKGIIFDMDGVLIEAKDWHYDALNEALSRFGFNISRHDHLVTFDGLPTREKLKMLSKERGLPEQLHEFLNRLKQKYTLEIVHECLAPNITHQYALSKLAQDGYRLAVASNSVRNSVTQMMELSSLIEYLDFYLSNEDVSKGKPDPEIYITAINKLGFKPNECLIIEDNPHGIAAAEASGGHVLKVTSTEETNYKNIKKFIRKIEAS